MKRIVRTVVRLIPQSKFSHEEVDECALSTIYLGVELIASAINHGYRLIDTAEFYENEDAVGQALKVSGKNREDIFIVSKWWPVPEGAKSALKTLDRCLKK